MTTKYWNCLGSGAQLPRIPNPTSRAPGVAWHALQHQCVHVLKMTLTQNMSSLKHGMRRLKYDMRRLSCDMRKLKTKIKSSGMMCCLADHGKACVILADCAMQCDTAGSQIKLQALQARHSTISACSLIRRCADQSIPSSSMPDINHFFFFHCIPYNLGCGASCDSSDILA